MPNERLTELRCLGREIQGVPGSLEGKQRIRPPFGSRLVVGRGGQTDWLFMRPGWFSRACCRTEVVMKEAA